MKKKKVLLIIDNSLFIIERVVRILKDLESVEKIYTATHYDEAVAILQEKETDIILLDIQLSGRNGLDLLNYIRLHYKDKKIIVFSNQASDYYQKIFKKAGAICFIDKSEDFDKIPAIIQSI